VKVVLPEIEIDEVAFEMVIVFETCAAGP